MLNRLLMVVHWILFLWGLGLPLAFIWDFFLIHKLLNGPYIHFDANFLLTGTVLAVVYVIALWIIKHRWIWFPWQHDRD